jgi:hypothetical protein
MYSTVRLLVATLFVLSSSLAHSSDWSCLRGLASDEQAVPVLFLTKGLLLIEEPSGTRYRILENNDHAILAEYHYADFDPVLTSPLLFITTMMIDKSSLRFTHTTAINDREPRQFSGFCRLKTSAVAISEVRD